MSIEQITMWEKQNQYIDEPIRFQQINQILYIQANNRCIESDEHINQMIYHTRICQLTKKQCHCTDCNCDSIKISNEKRQEVYQSPITSDDIQQYKGNLIQSIDDVANHILDKCQMCILPIKLNLENNNIQWSGFIKLMTKLQHLNIIGINLNNNDLNDQDIQSIVQSPYFLMTSLYSNLGFNQKNFTNLIQQTSVNSIHMYPSILKIINNNDWSGVYNFD